MGVNAADRGRDVPHVTTDFAGVAAMMIAERGDTGTEVVRPGVSAEELERIVAMAGFTPARAGGSTLAADDHPVAVATRVAATAAVLRLIAVLGALVVIGGVAGVLA